MITAIDTNVIVSLWDTDSAIYLPARTSLEKALSRGELVISAVVFAELMAFQKRPEDFIDKFLEEGPIAVDWNMEEGIWRLAGRAFQARSIRRRREGEVGPRRILPDFLIGAHAVTRGFPLLTYDRGGHFAAFPNLRIVFADE